MTRMFEGLRTWNPVFGCLHNCYDGGCWAKKKLAHRMGARFNCQMCYDFKPHVHEERLDRIPPDPRIFVTAHGDLFGDWFWWKKGTVERILSVCRETEKELWFFETKNPRRYLDFVGQFPQNTMLSVTMETNREYPESIKGNTPHPRRRFLSMMRVKKQIDWPIHVSVEPILDFDLDKLLGRIRSLEPVWVSVGYDSLNNGLPEPPISKTMELIKELSHFTWVERKKLD